MATGLKAEINTQLLKERFFNVLTHTTILLPSLSQSSLTSFFLARAYVHPNFNLKNPQINL